VQATVDAVLEQLEQPRLTAIEIGDVRVRITHPERVLWPSDEQHAAFTRRDLLRYFACIDQYLLPHLHDRPLTLKRYPYGLTGRHFYQMHVEFELPPYVERVPLFAEEHASDGDHIVCNSLPTLLWLGQIANLELHPWYSRISPLPDAPDLPLRCTGSVEALERSVIIYPDFMVFDLDPYLYSGRERRGAEPEAHREGYQRCCEAAYWLKAVLDELRLPSFVKTSGKTGLHILVPIQRQLDYDTVRAMSGQICRYVLQQHPAELTMEWSVGKRSGKVFLDHNQNTRGKTLAAPYSPRALPGAPVSVPLRWDEVGRVYPTDFTITSVHRRVDEVGDLWQDVLAMRADLASVVA
jgi:bifunctional non-homologous end joining protein LigD